jgi:uncharacterized protein YqeY
VAQRAPLDEPALLQILGRQAKMRRESIEAFAKGGRAELVAKETAELGVLESYLPVQLGEAQIEAAARRAIAETGASGAGAQGRVMQKVMAELRGRADGKVVAAVVARLLSGEDGLRPAEPQGPRERSSRDSGGGASGVQVGEDGLRRDEPQGPTRTKQPRSGAQ